MDFLTRLRQAFQGRPRSQIKAFAERCGIAEQTMRNILSGVTQNPGFQRVEKIRLAIERDGWASIDSLGAATPAKTARNSADTQEAA